MWAMRKVEVIPVVVGSNRCRRPHYEELQEYYEERIKSNINNTTQFFVPRISEAVCVNLVFLSEMASENLA